MAKNQQAAIASEVNELLSQGAVAPREFVHAVEAAANRRGDEIYSVLLHTAVHLEFGKRAARRHFEAVVDHWRALCTDTAREVDFRVALLDYFLTINRRIKNPKIIEIKIYEKTRQETETDELTGLFNYRYFRRAIDLEVCRSQRYHAPLSLVLFDADNFKFYNDANGHLAGNKALKKLAGIIRRSVREVDVVARFGGEEFAVLLPRCGLREAQGRAESLRQEIEALRPAGHAITVSIGLASTASDPDLGLTELLTLADRALYAAKAHGRNQVCG